MPTVVDLSRPAPEVAPGLLGCRLTSHTPDGDVTLVLTEVEAYEGAVDPASHAHRGETPRNSVMFGPAGHAYVYRSHGIHWCLNVVTGPTGTASAVLLRAGRVVDGEDLARTRRGAHVALRSLARGPGNLGRALGISAADNGADLLSPGHLSSGHGLHLSLTADPVEEVAKGPRVGVSLAADVPWRFWLPGEPTVSAYRRSVRAMPAGPSSVS